MRTQHESDLATRVAILERRSRAGWTLAVLMAVPLLLAMLGPPGSRSHTEDELVARKLIIEDAQGRPRIVLAAPIAELAGRVRKDPATGLLVLDENGVDRVVVGAPTTDPHIRGQLGRRIGPSAGINFNDRAGNERGGLGVLDHDNRSVLGLDREGGEGVALFVHKDYAGLIVSGGEGGGQNQRVFLGTNVETDTTVLNLDDHEGKRRFQVTLEPGTPAHLQFYDDELEPLVTIPESD